MGPSVPDWASGRAGGWGVMRAVGVGEGSGLERASAREWAQSGENRGTRTGACTDISPTSLHTRKHSGNQRSVENWFTTWRSR